MSDFDEPCVCGTGFTCMARHLCLECGGEVEHLDPTGDDLAAWHGHAVHPTDGHAAKSVRQVIDTP